MDILILYSGSSWVLAGPTDVRFALNENLWELYDYPDYYSASFGMLSTLRDMLLAGF